MRRAVLTTLGLEVAGVSRTCSIEPPMIEPPHFPLCKDKVRHVGDQVALVIGEPLGTMGKTLGLQQGQEASNAALLASLQDGNGAVPA